jgi:RHS repeat-associated protein
MTYNSAGQIATSTRYVGGTGLTTTYTYNGGDLVQVSDPLNRTIQYFTDDVGRTVAIVDALGNTTRVVYDNLDRVLQRTDPLGNTLQSTFDGNGNLLTFQDARGNVTTFTYDVRNHLSSVTDALGKVESYSYDAFGNRIQVTDRKGQVSGFTYDLRNRMVSAGFGATVSNPTNYLSTIALTWDGGGRLTQTVDSQSGTITRSYDGLDRLTQEQSPQGQVSYTYYPQGLRQSMSVQGQSTVTYVYDIANRLTQIAQGGASINFGYDSAYRRSSLTLPNGIVVGYTYDNASEVTTLTYQNGSSTIGTLTYSYDALGRRSGAGGSLLQMSLPAAVSSASYDVDNRLTSWGGVPLTYDNNGSLATFGSSTFTWDSRNQLTATSDGSGAFAYDSFGRRVSSTVSGTTTTYLYDRSSAVMSNSDFLLRGLGLDDLYARVRSSGTTSFLTDAMGSTIALTDSTGATTTTYSYEPYGKTRVTGTDDTAFRFTGREDDGATNLYYYRARYYSPQLGRFISEDPLRLSAGPNPYAYAVGNPLQWADPLGLCPPGYDPSTGGLTRDAQDALDKWSSNASKAAEAQGNGDIKIADAYREAADYWQKTYSNLIGQGAAPGGKEPFVPELAKPPTIDVLPPGDINWPTN